MIIRGAHDVVIQRWFSTLPTTCYCASLLLYLFQLVRASILLRQAPSSQASSRSISSSSSRRAKFDNSPLVLPSGIVAFDALRIFIDLAALGLRTLVSPHQTPHRYRILRQLLDVTADALDSWALTVLLIVYVHVFTTGIGFIRPLPKLETTAQRWIGWSVSLAEGLNFVAGAVVFIGREGRERDGTLRLGIGKRISASAHLLALTLLLLVFLWSLCLCFRFPHPTRLPVDDWTRSRHAWTCLATLAGLAYRFVGLLFRALPPKYRAARHLAHPFWTHMTEYWAVEGLLYLAAARDKRWKELRESRRARRSDDGFREVEEEEELGAFSSEDEGDDDGRRRGEAELMAEREEKAKLMMLRPR